MAERTKERGQSTERRRGPEEGPPPTANPKTVEKGKQLKENLDKVLAELDDLLAEEAERRGHGTGEDASIAAAKDIVKSYVQQGGE